MHEIIARTVYSVCTVYMMVILIRWFAPWLQIELEYGRTKWVCRVTDPLLDWVRRVIPSLGPMDFAPLVTLVGVWFIRTLAVGAILNAAGRV